MCKRLVVSRNSFGGLMSIYWIRVCNYLAMAGDERHSLQSAALDYHWVLPSREREERSYSIERRDEGERRAPSQALPTVEQSRRSNIRTAVFPNVQHDTSYRGPLRAQSSKWLDCRQNSPNRVLFIDVHSDDRRQQRRILFTFTQIKRVAELLLLRSVYCVNAAEVNLHGLLLPSGLEKTLSIGKSDSVLVTDVGSGASFAGFEISFRLGSFEMNLSSSSFGKEEIISTCCFEWIPSEMNSFSNVFIWLLYKSSVMIVTEPKGSPAPRAASRSLHPVEMRLCPESQDLVPESLAFPEAPICEPRGRNLRKEDIAVEQVIPLLTAVF